MSAAPRIAVIDYGVGNRRSVEKALERVGARPEITADADAIAAADGLVLPGVGAFPAGAEWLQARGLDAVVRDRVAAGVPLLGLCLGMQLLFERSRELGGADGLGLLEGEVVALRPRRQRLPHIGWNAVRWERPSPLLAGLPAETYLYHVHSFAAVPADEADVLGTADYGGRFVAAVARPPVYGVQSHPEKSSAHGLALLANFARVCAGVSAAPA